MKWCDIPKRQPAIKFTRCKNCSAVNGINVSNCFVCGVYLLGGE